MKHIIQVDGLLWEAASASETEFKILESEPNLENWKNYDTKIGPGSTVRRRDVIIKFIVKDEQDQKSAEQANARRERLKREFIKLKTFNTVLPQNFRL